MKAREWLERGNSSGNCIDAFSNYWRGFNNQFSIIKGGNERSKICKYISDSVSEKFAEEILSKNAQNVTYLTSQPVVDMRGNGNDTAQYIQEYNAKNTDLERLISIFMIIYQIRCNLEHGQKSPSRTRDIELCDSSAPIVAALVALNA